jgi:hypothetical protein
MTGIEAAVSSYGSLAVLAGTLLEGETIILIAGYMAHRGYFPLPEVLARYTRSDLLVKFLPLSTDTIEGRRRCILREEDIMDQRPYDSEQTTTKNGNLTITYRDPNALHVSDTYQAFDPLPEEEKHALHDDIQARGIQVPVEIDQDGNVLDGHNRVEIARELGILCPFIVHTYETEADKLEHAIKANLLRRHVSPIAWARAMQRLLDAKGIARQSKRNRFTGRDDTVSALYAEVGVNERTAQRRFELFDALRKYPDLVRQVDTGEKSVAAAKREAVQREGKAKTEKPKKPGNIEALTKTIAQCVEKYMKYHDIVAHVRQLGRQVIVDVLDEPRDTFNCSETFRVDTENSTEQVTQEGLDITLDTPDSAGLEYSNQPVQSHELG